MAALANNLTIFEARSSTAPQMVVIDDGEKYAIATEETLLRDLFTADGGLVPIIDAIQSKVNDFVPDLTTTKGRAEIRALAHKVTRSKTYLDSIGKDMVAELKDLPRRIDANRKMLRDQLDALADATRQPLTEWEQHTKAISDRLNVIDAMPVSLSDASSEEIKAQIERLSNMPLTAEAWEGLLDEATAITRRTIPILTEMFAAKRKAELEAEELQRLRAEAAERERRDAEAQRIAEAQERGRREAEQRAESERQAALGREAEAKRQAELAEQRLAEAKRLSEERDREYQRQREEQERLYAERAEQARVQAIEAERQRQAEAERIASEQKAAREADQSHRKQVNREVAADIEKALHDSDYDPDMCSLEVAAKAITIAIIKGQIRHTTITY